MGAVARWQAKGHSQSAHGGFLARELVGLTSLGDIALVFHSDISVEASSCAPWLISVEIVSRLKAESWDKQIESSKMDGGDTRRMSGLASCEL